MKAVILAAGVGSRLGNPFPKSLNKLSNGETILGRQIRLIKEHGIQEIIIVVGFKMLLIMENFPEVYYKYNPIYYITNTSKSLLSGIKDINDDVIWMNGDVIFESEILDKIIKTNGNCVAVNNFKCGDEEVKYISDQNNDILEISKSVINGQGEAVGINKISRESIDLLRNALSNCKDGDYFEKAIEFMINDKIKFKPVDISEFKCIEIDFEEDWNKAKELF